MRNIAKILFIVSSVSFIFLKYHVFTNHRDIFPIHQYQTNTNLTLLQPIATQLSSDIQNTINNQVIWHGSREKPVIALTFDADMTPVMVSYLQEGTVKTYDDQRITDYLTANDIKATFFLTGLWIQSYPAATRELAKNPLFELENHTYSHPSMDGYCFDQPQIAESQYPFEIEKTQELLRTVANVQATYFRFPGGCYNQADLNLVAKERLHTIQWDVVANDGFNSNAQEIIHNVVTQVKNGSIIVMHIGGQPNTPKTADTLPIIIRALKQKGFTFVKLSELLDPPKGDTPAYIDPERYLLP